MAGRRPQRIPAISHLAVDSVADSATQRAFDATTGAVVDLQTKMRQRQDAADSIAASVASLQQTSWLNVLDFGAKGNGGTDDTAAIQDALDEAEGSSAVVYLPRTADVDGLYAITDTLYIPNKVVLTGIGRSDSGLKASALFPNDGRPMVRLGRATDTLVFGSRVEHMTINANSRAGTCVYTTVAQEQSGVRHCVLGDFTQYGIHFTNDGANFTSGVSVTDVEVLPPAAGATTGIFIDGTALCTTITRCTVGVSGPLTNALHVTRGQALVESFHFENCTNGINLDVFSSCLLIGINPTNTIPNVTNVILDSSAGSTMHVGIGLLRNAATNLINYGGGSVNTDAQLPLWVMGNTILQGPLFQTFEFVAPQIASNQNDYSPPGSAQAAVWHLSSDAARDVTGIVLATGRVLKVRNRGAFTITLKHQDGGSVLGNRINGRGNADVLLLAGTTVELYKSAVDNSVEVMNNP